MIVLSLSSTTKPVKKGLMYLAPNGVDKVTIHLTPSDRRGDLFGTAPTLPFCPTHTHTTSVERIARNEHRDMVCSYRLGRRMHR